jgi:hypothetical protein
LLGILAVAVAVRLLLELMRLMALVAMEVLVLLHQFQEAP